MQNQPKLVEKEIWRTVTDVNGKKIQSQYKVSNFGRVMNKWGRVINGRKNEGYLTVDINIDGRRAQTLIHRIVAQYFVPNDDPEAKKFVIHKDWDGHNNHYTNLLWVSEETVRQRFSVRYQIDNITGKRTHAHSSKLSREDVLEIKRLLNEGEMNKTIAAKFNISAMQVSRIKKGENWAHIKPE